MVPNCLLDLEDIIPVIIPHALWDKKTGKKLHDTSLLAFRKCLEIYILRYSYLLYVDNSYKDPLSYLVGRLRLLLQHGSRHKELGPSRHLRIFRKRQVEQLVFCLARQYGKNRYLLFDILHAVGLAGIEDLQVFAHRQGIVAVYHKLID